MRPAEDWREQQRQQIIRYLELRTRDAASTRLPAPGRWDSQQQRDRLRGVLGIGAVPRPEMQWVRLSDEGVLVEELSAQGGDGVTARALVFSMPGVEKAPAAVAIPDALESAEEFAGVAAGATPAAWLTDLLSRGVVVAVPSMIERKADHPLSAKLKGKDRRHILHRLGYVTGRSLSGLDVEAVLLVAGALGQRANVDRARIAVIGRGQGGRSALLAAAVDPALAASGVADDFGPRDEMWREPVDRMLPGLLLAFGDAEIAALVAPRRLVLAFGDSPKAQSAGPEVERLRMLLAANGQSLSLIDSGEEPLRQVVERLYPADGRTREVRIDLRLPAERIDKARNEQFDSLYRYLRARVAESGVRRAEHWGLKSASPSTQRALADRLVVELEEYVGVPRDKPVPLNPRTRLIKITDQWVGYEVLVDALEGVEAYGHLLVPRRPGQRLPAVICQHGLNGQPSGITGIGDDRLTPYHGYGAALAERGYVVFAPYVTVPSPQGQLINELVLRAAPLGMMRTAIEVRKLRAILDFLVKQPFVDPDRIGYYGLSYGGYSAIWMAPLEPRLRAVIISGHFNEWTVKITDEELGTSYLHHPDEDFYTWNVLHRFTHPELMAAVWPRAVMVEFADKDSTTTLDWHGRAWEQVERLAAALGMRRRVERDWFHGVHEVGGMRSFEFLDRHLKPELPSARDYSYHLWPERRDLPSLGDNPEDTLPYIVHRLDSREENRLRDTFRISAQTAEFHGIELRLSSWGEPGDLRVRFGSKPGAADLGEARITAGEVTPLYDLWYPAAVQPVKLVPGVLYHVEVTAEPGATAGAYLVYGPRPLGGKPRTGQFPFAYRPINRPKPAAPEESRHEFVRQYLRPNQPAMRIDPTLSPRSGEIVLNAAWTVMRPAQMDPVVETAAGELGQFLRSLPSGGSRGSIELARDDTSGITSVEGYRIVVEPARIRIEARTSRGLMRGVYAIEDRLLARGAPFLERGTALRNERFARRITTAIIPGGDRYTEASRPLIYTDGLLQRISRDGFNAIWMWLNTEEAAMNSRIFPELDDPETPARLARIDDLTRRAKRFGIDVYIYLGTGYHHNVPAWFYQKYPELKGYGWGSPMETTIPRVRDYQAEIVGNIFRHAPELKGMVVIYDGEGFYHSGINERTRQQCRTCRDMTQEEISLQVLNNLNDAMLKYGGPDKELIAWSYWLNVPWTEEVIAKLPKNVIVQSDFSKSGLVVRDDVRHFTGDYNLTLVGPPDVYVRHHEVARAAGLRFITKTEHAVSQEFIFVPYIPAMEQWMRRIEKIREFDAIGLFANWCHYGYLASVPAQLLNEMAFDPVPPRGEVLESIAARAYGRKAAPLLVRAWQHFSDGIRQFPYSDGVARVPGPLQKGPSNPFFLDPNIKHFGRWRAWQNDLGWTNPWGPDIAAKYLSAVRVEFLKGATLLDEASAAAGQHRDAIQAERRIVTLLESSLLTVLHLIEWHRERDRFYAAAEGARGEMAASLERILIAERANVQRVLPVIEADSRLGIASEGGGVIRGGLFTPKLVRWKIGQLDDVLRRELPELSGRQPAGVPWTIGEPMLTGRAR
jgi:dienelactone hydrolase